jgi:catechol 2,3-dioxygenase-like lactoylglutathione lyase family enzyme
MTDGPPPLDGIHHLKVFVTDLDASLTWWKRAFGADRVEALDHYTPEGTLFAYLLSVPGIDSLVELRHDPAAAGRAARLDPVTFAVAAKRDLQAWAEYLASSDIEHSGVLTAYDGWLLVIRTPDGLSIRLITRESHGWDPARADLGSPWLSTQQGA